MSAKLLSSRSEIDRVAKACSAPPSRGISKHLHSADGQYQLVLLISLFVGGLGYLSSASGADERISLGLPVNCKLGHDCFVQQMPDVDRGDGTLDPLCGQATYQGHTGWDIRLRSLSDVAQDVPVVAVADGTVIRTQNDVPDQIFDAANDRQRLHDNECGNGIMIDHQDGLSSQYCHLRNDSLLVHSGMQVRKGQRVGSIGSSGVAEFPHVHLSVRQDGKLVEPLTGKALGDEAPVCGDLSGSLLDAASREALAQPSFAILDVGVAGTPPDLSALVRTGGPALATGRSSSTIAWVWAINVDEGSRFRIRMIGPGRVALIDHTTSALPGRKANYLAYVGRKVGPKPGAYRLTVEVITKDKKQIASKVRLFTIAN